MEFVRASYSRHNLIEAGKMLSSMHKPTTKKEHLLYSLETLRVADKFDELIGNGGSYCRSTYYTDYMRAVDAKDRTKAQLDKLFDDWRKEAIWECRMTIGMIDKGEVGNLDVF